MQKHQYMKNLLTFILCILFIKTISAQNSSEITQSNNKFTFDIYQELKNSQTNLVFSPHSISSALSMVYIGAKDNTAEEIRDVFYLNPNIQEFSKSYQQLNLTEQSNKNEKYLYNANSLWIQQGLKLKTSFLDANKKYFSASLNQTDFINKTEESRLKINKWVSKNTKNRINDLLPASSIDRSTRLVLVNAIYFKSSWKYQFNEKNNYTDYFQAEKNNCIEVEYMKNKMVTSHYQDRYAQVIEIPYETKEVSLLIILPNSFRKLRRLEKKLDYEYYNHILQNKERKSIHLSLPKFDIESTFELKNVLQELGVKSAFSDAADFSGMSNEKLYISSIAHKANITANEKGTEAAAATAVMMRKMSVNLESIDLEVDKPFIFILKNNQTNHIYFIGKITNPK